MIRALFRRVMKWRAARNVQRGSGYSLSPEQAESIADAFLIELLRIDVANCNNKNPSVIKRELIFLPTLNRQVEGWHCYKSSNGKVYTYMLATQERIIT